MQNRSTEAENETRHEPPRSAVVDAKRIVETRSTATQTCYRECDHSEHRAILPALSLVEDEKSTASMRNDNCHHHRRKDGGSGRGHEKAGQKKYAGAHFGERRHRGLQL